MTHNHLVAGSNPAGTTIEVKMSYQDSEGVKVSIVEFDQMENRAEAAISEKELAIFVGIKENLSAFCRAQMFISKLPPCKVYLAYNNEVYPQYKVKVFQVQ